MDGTEDRRAPDPTAFLRRTRLWREASDESVRSAVARLRFVRAPAGETLIRQGQQGERLLLLVSGRVDVRVRATEGDVTTVAGLGENECIGEMSLLSGDRASADVVTTTPVEAYELTAADFAELTGNDAALLRELLKIVSLRLALTDTALGMLQDKGRCLEQLLDDTGESETEFIGKSPDARKTRERVAELAAAPAPVLVLGERGSGKETVARMLHAQARRGGAFVVANCKELADNEWGDRLFGPRGGGGRGTPGFIDMASRGTLFLDQFEHLPPGVQTRLARHLAVRAAHPRSEMRDGRIVASASEDPAAAGSRISPALLEYFGDRRIAIPPLRTRKRDIPEIAEHYLRKHAVRLSRAVPKFSDHALSRLVAYDYRIGNLRELEDAVERAVRLTDGDTVQADVIFLGPPPTPGSHGIDLLRLPGLDVRRLVPLLPKIGRGVSAAAFVAVLGTLFLAPTAPAAAWVTGVSWTVGWPAMAVSFFLVARGNCAVCPMGFAAEAASWVAKSRRRVPAWIEEHEVKIGMAGFFLIVLVEETTSMRHSPLLTGLLLLTLAASAVVFGVLYPRRTWCRHVCPLGRMAGMCSTSSFVELRPSFDICSAKCRDHACFKGNDRARGCPMSNHVMFVDTNQNCVLCMYCVRACPNDSPQLNLRMPARELWAGVAAQPELGLFVLMMLGTVASMTLLQSLDATPAAWAAPLLRDSRVAFVAGVLAIGAALPLLATWPVRRALARREDPDGLAHFWRRVTAMIPLLTATFVAYQLAYVPGLAGLRVQMDYDGSGGLPLQVLGLARVAVLSGGLLTTAVVLWRLDLATGAALATWRARWRRDTVALAVTVGYVGLCAWLMLR